ncbi:alpha/beta hydrolase [Nonomuraea jiangxiensis]|uniref:Alpha/beta hydrolase n=1 Tax=Nonomuraea jiangxiensis TaxID=633440 RepID=A0A1G8WNI2_9ACTN|nr:alpha/beta hydrolase [Nonomuraea jiangxiensis]SDJ79889.1 Alpha/beta hydrolase [Nonomuraea jiangxiensis]
MLRHLSLSAILAAGAILAWPGQPPGRLVKVYGDPATADRVAVIVPGADTTVATFDNSYRRPGGAARALRAEAARLAPGQELAVVAWLGYDAPLTVSLDVLTDGAAVEGAAALRHTVERLHRGTTASIALLCHSYGSALCARAVPGLPVTDLAVFGSPGLAAPSAAALAGPPGPTPGTTPATPPLPTSGATQAGPHRPTSGGKQAAGAGSASPLRVWAGLGGDDWVRFVPKVKIGPFGFGADPMSGAFGARVFETGPGGHSDYFAPGTPSLRNLALIALGRRGQVTPLTSPILGR